MGWGSGSRICLRRRRGGVRGGYRRHEQRCCRPVATARTSFGDGDGEEEGERDGRRGRADGVKRKESQRLASRRVRAEIDAHCAGRVRSSRHRATPGAQPRPYVFRFAPSVLTGLLPPLTRLSRHSLMLQSRHTCAVMFIRLRSIVRHQVNFTTSRVHTNIGSPKHESGQIGGDESERAQPQPSHCDSRYIRTTTGEEVERGVGNGEPAAAPRPSKRGLRCVMHGVAAAAGRAATGWRRKHRTETETATEKTRYYKSHHADWAAAALGLRLSCSSVQGDP